jgi:uncharacterized protein YaaQ
MKLVIVIIQDKDVLNLMDAITEAKFGVTKLASTGGFLREGNTTLLIGVEKEKVDEVISIVKVICKKRNKILDNTPYTIAESTGIIVPYSGELQVEVGGATVFVVDVDKFIKV